jgi:hypothetical protein
MIRPYYVQIYLPALVRYIPYALLFFGLDHRIGKKLKRIIHGRYVGADLCVRPFWQQGGHTGPPLRMLITVMVETIINAYFFSSITDAGYRIKSGMTETVFRLLQF